MSSVRKGGQPYDPWWKKTTIYQIYPRSWMDGNGDGIGDLAGIVSRLDYLKETGFETIWFSPFFSSPQKDFGYDISDYRNISPEYGTLDDCTRLIEEVHRRDMKIVLDLVLNHTSDLHPWFTESRSSRDNPKRDWYIWRDGTDKDGRKPPNNWRALAGTGSGWQYDEPTKQWYWASFLPFQPDLNYRNPEVKREMLDTVRFWLEKGADGFRLDIFGSIYKEENFTDNPFAFRLFPGGGNEGGLFRSAEMIVHRPEVFQLARELRMLTDEYSSPERFMIGEVFAPYTVLREYCGGDNADALHLSFLFQSVHTRFSARAFRRRIAEFEKHFAPPLLPVWVFSNHDCTRRISVLGNDPRKARLSAALLFTVRGVPCTYYGEEIGMHQSDIDPKENLDPVGRQFARLPRFLRRFIQKKTNGAAGRDGCRTPMQWNSSNHAGFCPAGIQPWLPVHKAFPDINAESEQKEPDSLYSCYRRFLEVRKKHPALNSGSLELLTSSTLPRCVLAYRRMTGTDEEVSAVVVLLNFSGKRISFHAPFLMPESSIRLLASTHAESRILSGAAETGKTNMLRLMPYEGTVVETSATTE